MVTPNREQQNTGVVFSVRSGFKFLEPAEKGIIFFILHSTPPFTYYKNNINNYSV